MSEISREYFRVYRLSTIFVWIWSALISFGLFTTARKREISFHFEYIVIGLVIVYALALTITTLCAPKIFANKLKKLSDSEQSEILNGKFVKIGERRFYEHFLLYYFNRNIQIVRFSDIISIEPKGRKLRFILKNGKKATIFIEQGENSAMLAAAIKSKNAEISVIIGGKVIKNTEKSQ